MRRYARNSPEAVGRILAMALVSDGGLDEREIDAVERLDMLREVGLTREAFSRVVAEYCDDLGGSLEADAATIDHVLADVDAPDKRAAACAMMLSLCYADGRFAPREVAVMRRVLQRWGLAIESVRPYGASRRRAASRPRPPVARHLRRERPWGEEGGERRRPEPVIAD
jgi:uncharacterized tellurite resistance protein B-like protein